jgi:molecular chaperone GrpE
MNKNNDKNGAEDKKTTEAETARTDAERAESEIEKLKHELLLNRADFENIRRRLEKEKQDDVKYASFQLVRDLLEVLDNMELALNHAAEGDPMRKGVEMVLEGMQKTLLKYGVRKIGLKGEPFNPQLHEAFTMAADTALPDNVVLEVARPGYLLHDRLLRAAGVIVNRHPHDTAAPD